MPKIDVKDAPQLVDLFDEPLGSAAVEVLATNKDALRAELSEIVTLFRKSLKTRYTSLDADDARRYPDVLPLVATSSYARSASLWAFRSAGPDAYQAAEDLVELLVRRVESDEFAASPHHLETTLASVCRGRPDILIKALRHKDSRVRIAIVETLRGMEGDVESTGPALAALIGDEDDYLVGRVISVLESLEWSNADVVRSLRARIQGIVSTKQARRLRAALKRLESIATE